MASGILLNIQEEVTCPVCLELMTEPMSLDCGHSFCQACIAANNKESGIGQEGESSCPVCRVSYQPENLRPNRHVANIVERLREVKVSPEEGPKSDLCVHHGEKLLLFCKEDGKIICWLCERSQKHRGHHTFLLEEVAQEYQKKLQEALKRLMIKNQEAEKLETDIKEERMSWKNQIQKERQSVQNMFKKLKAILDSEEQRKLQKLEKEEGDILQKLAESEIELVQQSQLVRDLISDLEQRLQGSAMEMLQDVNGIMERSNNLTLKKPKTVSKNQRMVFKAAELGAVLQVFEELAEVQSYWVDFMLNPVSAVSNIVVSEAQRQVRVVHPFKASDIQPYNIFALDVLGCQHYSSGKYYWEVDVSRKNAWILGVYSKNVSNKKINFNLPLSQNVSYPFFYNRYRPENGYWVVGLQNKSEYKAFEDSSISDSNILTLSIAIPPCRVGVFLDFERSTVSFFNVTNHGSLIYKFSHCRFSKITYPYFNPWNCCAPMTLCQPNT